MSTSTDLHELSQMYTNYVHFNRHSQTFTSVHKLSTSTDLHRHSQMYTGCMSTSTDLHERSQMYTNYIHVHRPSQTFTNVHRLYVHFHRPSQTFTNVHKLCPLPQTFTTYVYFVTNIHPSIRLNYCQWVNVITAALQLIYIHVWPILSLLYFQPIPILSSDHALLLVTFMLLLSILSLLFFFQPIPILSSDHVINVMQLLIITGK